MTRRRTAAALIGLLVLFAVLLGGMTESADDWLERSLDEVESSARLAPELHLQWVRELPPLRPAWPDQPKLQFDAAYQPVARGNTLFVASSRIDGVLALDAETGEEKWRFTTDGPVRFAPTVWEDRVFFVSDDGYLYCLDADQGDLKWRLRGGPSERKVLGNGRLISMWPARGAPIVADGVVYFAAGIWPFMGIFLHAVDAHDGKVIWTNDGDGSLYIKQPHQTDSFAGVAPQGQLVVVGDKLFVPGGRSTPACYDRKTGKLLYYHLADHSKLGGGSRLTAGDKFFVNGGAIFETETGYYLGPMSEPVVLGHDLLFSCAGAECRAFDLRNARIKRKKEDQKTKRILSPGWKIAQVGSVSVPPVECFIKVGRRLYAGSANKVFAFEAPWKTRHRSILWQALVQGRPAHILAEDGRLFVSTREGRIYCFGADPVEPRIHFRETSSDMQVDEWTDQAARILMETGVREGYCICWGVGSGRLIAELARQSQLHVVAIDVDADKVTRFRAEMAAAGLYGERVAALAIDPDLVTLPPYLASLMVSEDLPSSGLELGPAFIRRAFESLRPFGGVACLPVRDEHKAMISTWINGNTDPAQAHVRQMEDWLLLSRDGPLPGSGDWTHEHADAANTRVSRDRLVKAPLGLLWFGGTSNDGILPRHGHGPQPQVIDGRAILEGVDLIRAVDIYTGRLLWETRLPGVGKNFDNLAHQPGANAGGGNYVSTADGIYVAYDKTCLRLDPTTGCRLAEFSLPFPPRGPDPSWDYLNVSGDYLVAGINFPGKDAHKKPAALSSSQHLTVLDRHSGQQLWTLTARNAFRHNAICIGGGKVYLVDRPSLDFLARFKRRESTATPKARLQALDLKTGRELWSTDLDIFGTWLSHSDKHDILVESGRLAKDTLSDEAKGMRAYVGANGKVLWYHKDYVGPAMIHGDLILKDKGACDVLNGSPFKITDPLTSLPVEWSWTRNYGCNTPAASKHLLTFRSGAAGYYDFCHLSGTGNFGGLRSGCTNNLIVAGGVLCSPDYTRTCTCSYQNQTSLALTPMPDAEMWTSYGPMAVSGRIKRLGINFGAPGDRKADNGALWLEYPSVGGPSPAVSVRIEPAQVDWFRRHESQVGGDLPWVTASGVHSVQKIVVALGQGPIPAKSYTVRLHFAEPEPIEQGERVFHVRLQGRDVLKNFDIVAEAGATNRGIVKEFKGVSVGAELTATFTAASRRPPLICGLEVQAEGW